MSSAPANVRRHFLPWDRPWLPQVTAWLARDWPGAGALDLSRILAVTPTRQAGRRLREALAAHAAARGAAVFAPRVMTPDTLIRQDPGEDIASPLQALFAWTEVLRSVELDSVREIFPVDPPARNFSWALRLAQMFVRLQTTLSEAGLRLTDVTARAETGFVEAERWTQIAGLERQQREGLEGRTLREPHAARLAAAENPVFEIGFDRIVVLGVADLPPLAASRLAHAARNRPSQPIDIVIFAPGSEAAHFDAWGRPLSAVWEHRTIELHEFEQRVHLDADPAAQAARVAELAASYTAPTGALGLGIADTEIAPLLENELNRRDLPAFDPDGRLLRGEGLYALLTSLAELVREPTFPTVEALARCPDFIAYLKTNDGSVFSAGRWLEGLDELRARHLPTDLAAARAFAAGLTQFPSVAHGLEAIAELRRQLVSERETFAESAAQALREIFGARQLELSRAADVRFEEAAAAWAAVLQECAATEERFGSLDRAEWWDLALRLFGEQRATGEKPPGALELQGWLELLWEDAPHLVVAGMNDGRVPEAVPEDAFLPGSLRQRLGLVTNANRFARDAYLLQAIAACRAERGRLDLVFGKVTAEGDPLRPSRLLLRCADAELPQRIALLFRTPERAEANAAWTRTWKLRPRLAPPPARIAVTALRRYLQCPFRFYLRNVLRMESVDVLKSELDALDFGTLCHAALERIGREATLRECVNAAELRAELLRHLERTVSERYGKLWSLPLVVQVESARQRLSRFAELQAAERAAGWEIVAVEREFEVEVAGLVVRGKIDRIDRHAETGAVRVLDYKTSDAPVTPAAAHLRAVRPGETVPEWARFDYGGKPRAFADLQLPLYLRALAAEYPGRLACGYFNLPKATGETALAPWDDYTAELHEAAMRCAEGACAAIRRGEFWPPNETLRAERDEYAALFHHGVGESVEWAAVK